MATLKIPRLPRPRRLSPKLKTTRNETREIAPCTIRPSSCSRQCLIRQVHAFSSLICRSPTYCDLSISCHLHRSHSPSRPSLSHRHHKTKPLSRVCAPSPFRLTSSFPTRSSLPVGLSSSPRRATWSLGITGTYCCLQVLNQPDIFILPKCRRPVSGALFTTEVSIHPITIY